MHCSYSFGFYSSIKYYVTFLHYKFIGFPIAARICAIVVTVCAILIIGLLLYNMIRLDYQKRSAKILERLRKKYEEGITKISYLKEFISQDDVLAFLDVPVRKIKPREMRLLLEIFMDVIKQADETFNIDNFKLVQKCLRVPDYFEREILKGTGKRRIKAFRTADTIEAYVKESIVSRFLFSSDKQLRMLARMYMVKYGTSYPFDIINENKDSKYTTENQALLHDVLLYRHSHGRSLPNFIHLLSDDNTSSDVKQFVVNEIGLLNLTSYGFYLSEYLKKCREESLQRATIRTLGLLRYMDNNVEENMIEIYQTVSLNVRRQIIKALGLFNSGRPEIVSFLEEEYPSTKNYLMKETVLSVLYDYGTIGRTVFEKLEAKASFDSKIFFEHVRCPLIDSRKYA